MADTLKQVSEKVTCHEKFIEGSEPSGRDGARSRLITVEDAIKRWIIGACITGITGVIVWLITSVLPSASAAHSIVMALLAK